MKAPALILDVVVILVAGAFAAVHPPLGFLDDAYANGFYTVVQTAITSWTNEIPFALGDVLLVVVVAGIVLHWVLAIRASRRWSTVLRLVLRTCAVAGILYVWFLIAWGWNYDRPGLSTVLNYRASHIEGAAFDRLEFSVVDALNAAAAPAHQQHDRSADITAALAAAQASTAQLVGITHRVVRTRPKHTILDPYFVATNISGMFLPFTYETYIASDVLWFEYPFTLEHEWSHAGGIARESDANFVASLATLGSQDPVLRYSGLLIVYAALPRRAGPDARLSKPVRSDYAAMRERDKLHIQPIAFKLAWTTYDKYLKSQHVRSGVVNYTEYVRLLLGTAVGRDTLARAIGRPVQLR